MTQGGGVAAPVGGQIFSEILPYLEVNQGNQEEVEIVEEVQAPDLLEKTLEEAEKLAKENELELMIENQTESEGLDKQNTIIKEQTPKAGITIKKGSKIYITIH
ncbi:MAG: PASTA domain-containing protein [Clostridia bacterium]|nr:PASTA domain-containing protein [Clostridia bacterium]